MNIIISGSCVTRDIFSGDFFLGINNGSHAEITGSAL